MANTRTVITNTKSILSGSGKAAASCGELLQGQFSQDEDFLVTLPINWYSTVTLSLTPDYTKLTISPKGKYKTMLAVKKLLHHLEHTDSGAEIWVDSTIPEGKGLGSSTADITAACRAVGAAFDVTITPELISSIAWEIEPSDGSMYNHSVSYNHRQCRLIDRFGHMPPCSLLVVDPGGEVNTVDFNRRHKDYAELEWKEFHELYRQLKAAFQQGNLEEIARVSTRSARINQRILYKPELEKLIQITDQMGGHGVCVAHSGTITGLIFDKTNHTQLSAITEVIQNEFHQPLQFFLVDAN